MERLLVVWCPALQEEDEAGRLARAFDEVVGVMEGFAPAVQVVAPGVAAVATRGPSRYFGGDDTLARRLATALSGVPGIEGPDDEGPGDEGPDDEGTDVRGPAVQVGVADGLFAAVLAARAAADGPVVVAPGGAAAFLAPWPVDVLGHRELADLLRRLGLRDLGSFAALPVRHVLARLGADGVRAHAVAGGQQGELPGLRVPRRTRPADRAPDDPGQAGFWGESSAAEARAGRAVARVEQVLGAGTVMVGRLQGGRGPKERARLVPWASRALAAGEPGAGPGGVGQPWPGQIPAPSPVTVLERALPADLCDERGSTLSITAAGTASAAPARLSVDGAAWRVVAGWAGPWPVDERWWAGRARRRRARMQVVTAEGPAYLLVRERGRWWLEGAYD